MSNFQFKSINGTYPVNVNISNASKYKSCEHLATNPASKTTIIMLNALGVTLKKYAKFIEGLSQKGFIVISADYPCCGENTPHIKRGIDYGYDELVNDFVHKLVDIAKAHAPMNNIVLVGHSLGGHLGTIYSTIHNVPVIGIASGSTHYKSWQGRGRIRILQAVAIIQTLIRIYGFLPGHKIGLGKREAKTMMNNWCRIALTDKFDFISSKMDRKKGRGLFINILGDDFAPLKSTEKLAARCVSAKIVRIKLDDDLKGNQHGVWIKRPDKVIERICEHLNLGLT